MKKSFFLAGLMVGAWLASGIGHASPTPAPALPGLFPRAARPQALEVIETGALCNADWHLAAIIQGMVNRQEPRLYLVNRKSESSGDEVLLSYYAREYGIQDLGEITVSEALKKYAGWFKGYAVFSFAEDWTVNIADTYCSFHDCLPISPDQEARAREAGLTKVEDFRGRWQDRLAAAQWSLAELYPSCSKKIVGSLAPTAHTCRDYFFANRIYTFYLLAAGREYPALRRLLEKLPRNIPTMGYIARSGPEEWIVEYTLAATGKFMVPSDLVPNLSVHSGIPIAPLPEIGKDSEPPDLTGKLGVVFALTDGDNLFIQTERYLRTDAWLHPERGRLQATWSVAPELYELAPGVMRYYYQTRTENDSFAALSGAGYTFPSAFSDPQFFSSVSIAYLKLTGLDVLWSLDPLLYFVASDRLVAKILGPLGADSFLRGILIGYAPPLRPARFAFPPGCPPVLYSQPNYFDSKPETLVRMLQADAAAIPRRGKLAFYGVNGWEIGYDDLLAIMARLNRDDVVLLSPQEALTIAKRWQK